MKQLLASSQIVEDQDAIYARAVSPNAAEGEGESAIGRRDDIVIRVREEFEAAQFGRRVGVPDSHGLVLADGECPPWAEPGKAGHVLLMSRNGTKLLAGFHVPYLD